MKKILKITALLLVLVMAMGMLAACESGGKEEESQSTAPEDRGALPGGKDIYNEPTKIAVISLSTAGQVNRMYKLALDTQAIRYPLCEVNFMDAEYNPNKQVTLVEEAITQGYDCIMLECMDPVLVIEAITKAEEAGIPVITTNAAEPFVPHTLQDRKSVV